MRSVLDRALADAAEVLATLRQDEQILAQTTEFAQRLSELFQSEGRILACGNGGSLADAMHFCEEFTGRFRNDRKPYGAIPLADPTHMSCTANDYGFEHVFSRQVEAFARPGDMLLLLSTSGNSPSIIRAAETARTNGLTVIGMLGRGGGQVAPKCDLAIIVPGQTSDRIQELHMLLLHAVIEAVEKDLGHA